MNQMCEITSSKRIFAADYVSAGVPFYRGKEITEKFNGKLDVSTELFISEGKFTEIERKFGAPRPGDLLLTSVGTLGSPYVVQPGDRFYFKDGNLTWFRHFNGLDSRFLYYWLVSPAGRAELMKSTIGVAQPALTIVALKRMEIALPTLPMQRRIAGILSGYDKLMEVCRRRIRTLEEMARALYREWFVEFRFPEHEKVPRVDSALGSIPKGWEVTKLGNILELNYGKALRQDQRRDGCVPVFGSSGIVGYHDECLARGPGIVVGRKGNVGSVFWCDEDFFVIDTAYFVSSSLPLRFLFYDLQTKNFINNDAAVPGLSRHQAYALETMVPPADLLSRFCRFADGFEGQASLFRRQVENLRHTRDLLLTRLLSGQVPLDIPEDEADAAEPEDVPFDLLPRTNGYRSATTEPRPASRAFPDTRSESGDDDGPPRIDDTERTAVLQKIRQVFSEGRPRTRDAAIGDVARALGYQRTGARIHEILHTDLLTAVRRGILENTGGELRLCARSIADYDRDFLKQQFLAAIGRTWICREDAIRQFCHWLGFARTGAIIEDIARSLINGLLREGRLEAEGAEMIRRV